jgi:peptide/nickel transport system ATP-binding protein
MLINALPRLGDDEQRVGISGRPPSLLNPPGGCRFADRCYLVTDRCREVDPPLVEVEPGRFAACIVRAPIALDPQAAHTTGSAGKEWARP